MSVGWPTWRNARTIWINWGWRYEPLPPGGPGGKEAAWECMHREAAAGGTVAAHQTLPWTMRGWHCGRSGNDTHLSIELCEDGLTDGDYFRAVYRGALPASPWAGEGLARAVALGVTDGSRPQGFAARQEVAIMVGAGK